MNRAHLNRLADNIETVLIFSKRVTFYLADALCFGVGLWYIVTRVLK
jgi:hypothetical protein